MLPGTVELALILFAFAVGWLVGFIGQTLPIRWRNRFEQEQAYFRTYREEADAVHANNQARIHELEAAVANRDATKTQHAVGPPVAVAVAVAAAADDVLPELEPTAPEIADHHTIATEPNLLSLSGLTPEIAERLHELGVHHPRDLAELTDVDEMALESHLGLPAGYITREQWRSQAGLLSPAMAAPSAP